jgi:uncharacterized protein involved in response to NO
MTDIEKQEAPAESTTIEKVTPAGELKLLALLMIIGVTLFVDSLKIDGVFQGANNGPGTLAQLIALALIFLVGGRAVVLIKDAEYKEGNWQQLKKYLFDQQVVILIVMIILYGLLVETLHFVPTSILFLITTMYLLERKEFVKKSIISCVFVGILYLVFSTAFQVVLP